MIDDSSVIFMIKSGSVWMKALTITIAFCEERILT
jgi:hypothetical protein